MVEYTVDDPIAGPSSISSPLSKHYTIYGTNYLKITSAFSRVLIQHPIKIVLAQYGYFRIN